MVKSTILIFYMTVRGLERSSNFPIFILILTLWRDGGWGNFDGNRATTGSSHTHVGNDE